MRERALFIGFFLLAITTAYIAWGIVEKPPLSLAVFSVGKGTAMLVKAPGGRTVLINTGPDAGILRALGETLPMWQRSLSAVVLTSIAAKEAGGTPAVLLRYRVAELIRPRTLGSKSMETALASSLRSTQAVQAHRGDRFVLGGGAFLDVLWPPKSPQPPTAHYGNLILRLSYGSTSFLIGEPLPRSAQSWYAELNQGIPLPTMFISSSTPPGVYISNGVRITKQ